MGTMAMVLLGVGAVSFIGYLIWLIICINNWDSKIPPIIGMVLSLVMLAGGLSQVPAVQDLLQKVSDDISAIQEAPKDAAPEDPPDGEDPPVNK